MDAAEPCKGSTTMCGEQKDADLGTHGGPGDYAEQTLIITTPHTR